VLPTNNHLILEQVEIGLGERKLVSLNTEVEAGQVLTVVGPSGSGKSTLLAFIAGFIAPVFSATGKVSLGDKELSHLPAEERRIGLLFQDAMLFPHMSVAQNLGFALAKTELNKKQKIEAGLEKMSLQGFAQRDPATLSGGQQARIALLRLLLSQPQAVLLDEPFSKLDKALRASVREQVFSNLREAGLSVILVSHDEEDAEAAGGQVISL